MSARVLLFWPNLIGYFRMALLLGAWTFYDSPASFLPLYITSVLLDGLDGWLARRLGQVSEFGAWLDVVVDNLSRALLWTRVSQVGWLVSSLEWCVFTCNHCSKGEDWKNSFDSSPKIVRAIMTNGFRTPLGVLVVSGLHGLPLWLYGAHQGLLQLPLWIQATLTALLLVGRALASVAEVWCIWTHVKFLTRNKNEEKKH
ncbi:uncharacterized protein [Eucyclogobius newberryi]|uniref:uncharacterized protein n=1 Tax=Eucyclogobius newberryi TaxID=166745 RepID=UPI003B58C1BF